MCQHLLQRVPAELYHSPLLAFELLRFCRDHARPLGAPLALNFPNLLKVRERRGPGRRVGVPDQVPWDRDNLPTAPGLEQPATDGRVRSSAAGTGRCQHGP